MKKFFLIGIGGTGMSSLAFFLKAQGHEISGSDRAFDQNHVHEVQDELVSHGIKVFPQDGSGINETLDGLIYSSAIEPDNPDLLQAKKFSIPLFSRAQMLAELFNSKNGIAVCGTSGKTTVTGMVAHILKEAKIPFSFLCGGKVKKLFPNQSSSNFHPDQAPLMLIEADESDGSLILYKPQTAIITNISKDHKDLCELYPIFQHLIDSTEKTLVLNKSCPELQKLRLSPVDIRYFDLGQAKDIQLTSEGSVFTFQKYSFHLKVPGRHNIENALAAIATAQTLGIAVEMIQKGLAHFQGIIRRLECVGDIQGIRIYDDYSHNPVKIEAALSSLIPFCKHLIVIYQPHGYGPLKHQWEDLIQTFSRTLRDEDLVYLLPVYDAGGTADRNISSKDFSNESIKKGINAHYLQKREELISEIAKKVEPGDSIVVMGARDHTLTDLAKRIFKEISQFN